MPDIPGIISVVTAGIILVVGIISVVIGGHFGGGDHFDGGDHFGGGTGASKLFNYPPEMGGAYSRRRGLIKRELTRRFTVNRTG